MVAWSLSQHGYWSIYDRLGTRHHFWYNRWDMLYQSISTYLVPSWPLLEYKMCLSSSAACCCSWHWCTLHRCCFEQMSLAVLWCLSSLAAMDWLPSYYWLFVKTPKLQLSLQRPCEFLTYPTIFMGKGGWTYVIKEILDAATFPHSLVMAPASGRISQLTLKPKNKMYAYIALLQSQL